VDAFGVDAVLRRGHPQVIGLDVGAPGERQVVLLAVLQRDALHADPLAVLKVNRLGSRLRGAILLPLARPPLLPPAVDDAAAGHLQVLDLVEVEPLPALAGAPVARALRRNDVPGNEQLDLAAAGPGERERPDPEGLAGRHVEDDVVGGGARGRPGAGEGLEEETAEGRSGW